MASGPPSLPWAPLRVRSASTRLSGCPSLRPQLARPCGMASCSRARRLATCSATRFVGTWSNWACTTRGPSRYRLSGWPPRAPCSCNCRASASTSVPSPRWRTCSSPTRAYCTPRACPAYPGWHCCCRSTDGAACPWGRCVCSGLQRLLLRQSLVQPRSSQRFSSSPCSLPLGVPSAACTSWSRPSSTGPPSSSSSSSGAAVPR
mmetsp:Transcript_43294/g.114887  ORF Transcript_43294/g.114887 Transcript_43294/m.114887 type:complete len:204 (+) Transcript_43294:88-699(+)